MATATATKSKKDLKIHPTQYHQYHRVWMSA